MGGPRPVPFLEERAGSPAAADAHLAEYLALFAETDYARPAVVERRSCASAVERFLDAGGDSALRTFAESHLSAMRRADADPALGLSVREREILSRLDGHSDRAIAEELGLTVHGVRYHLRRLFFRLAAKSRCGQAGARARPLLRRCPTPPQPGTLRADPCQSCKHQGWRQVMRMTHHAHESRTVRDAPFHRVIGATNAAGRSRRFAALALALLVLCASSAQAETPSADSARSDWYVALSGFRVMPRDSSTSRVTDVGRLTGDAAYGSSAAFSAAVGRHVMDNVRIELEVGYSPVDIEGMTDLRVDGRLIDLPYGLTGDSDVWTVTVAAVYDVPTEGPVRPYVGAGVGLARHETRTTFTFAGIDPVTESGDDTVLSYHLRAGLGYEVSDTVVVFAGYRYTGARDVEIGGTRSTSASDALEAGVRIRF